MSDQHDNSGILFKNTRKSEAKHPDYTGSATINGEKLELSAWIKEGKSGKFMSLSFRPSREEARREHHRAFDRPSLAKIERTEAARRRVMF